MNPEISFITAVKNRPLELKEMARSLVNQTMSEWEAIIVDDHSEEPIREVVESFHDDRLRYFRLPSDMTGISNARNFAIEQAKAEILLIADGDDINEPIRARITYDEMAKNNYDVFYSPLMDFMPEQNKKVKHSFQPFNAELLKMFNFVSNPSAAFRKRFFYLAGRFDPTFIMSEDYDLYLRMLKLNAKFGYTEKILVNYRRSEGSISVSKFPQMHSYVMKCRIENGIEPFDISNVKRYALPAIAKSVLSKNGRKLWQDDRFEKSKAGY